MASQQQQFDAQVLIIGGGIGGLTLAAICRKIGISCKVLERTKELTPAGAGISLSPNAFRVLDQLGVYRNIVEEGQRLRKIQVHRNRTKWSEIDFQWLEQTFGYPVYSIERHLFHHLLYAAAGERDTVLLDAEMTDIVDDPTQPGVMVKLSDGRSFVGEAVVGADGIRSATRRILAHQAGLESVNTIRFTGRVHMSGYTAPLTNLGPAEIGVGNWLLYDNSILTTWPCKDNRQWYIGVKVGADSDAIRCCFSFEKSLIAICRCKSLAEADVRIRSWLRYRRLSPSRASPIGRSGKGSTARRSTPSMEIIFILLQRQGTSVTV